MSLKEAMKYPDFLSIHGLWACYYEQYKNDKYLIHAAKHFKN